MKKGAQTSPSVTKFFMQQNKQKKPNLNKGTHWMWGVGGSGKCVLFVL